MSHDHVDDADLRAAGLTPPHRKGFGRGLLLGIGVGAVVMLVIVALFFFPILVALVSFVADVFRLFVDALWG